MKLYERYKQSKKYVKDFESLWLRRFMGFDIPYNKERFNHHLGNIK